MFDYFRVLLGTMSFRAKMLAVVVCWPVFVYLIHLIDGRLAFATIISGALLLGGLFVFAIHDEENRR